MQTYLVTKHFTDGFLAGMTITERTKVQFPVGFYCSKPIGGSSYIVKACVPSFVGVR